MVEQRNGQRGQTPFYLLKSTQKFRWTGLIRIETHRITQHRPNLLQMVLDVDRQRFKRVPTLCVGGAS